MTSPQTPDVVIAGIAQTPVGEHWDRGLRNLGVQVIRDAIRDSGGLRPQALFVGNMLAPNLSHQSHLAALLADYAELGGIEAVTTEAAGASGGAALRQGYLAIKSGMADVALVVGVEKSTEMIGGYVEEALASAQDSDYEAVQGLTATAQAAMLMQRYMHESAMTSDGLAGFAITAHANGVHNPNAMFRSAVTAEAYHKAPVASEPLSQLDIAPLADGAAAVVLVRSDLLPAKGQRRRVSIAGSAAAADRLALHDRKDALSFEACKVSAEHALAKAGMQREQLGLVEYHDSFSIYAALQLEAMGFAPRGEGWKLAADGKISAKGAIPCATMGGLKARGFPGGATGVYQAVEAVLQLRGEAGENQVTAASAALIQSVGGPGSTAVSHILTGID